MWIVFAIFSGIVFGLYKAISWIIDTDKGIYSYETYLSYILRWDPKWLDEADLDSRLLHQHSCVNGRSPLPVQERYKSFVQYELTILPWLLEETWENIKRDEQERLARQEGALPPVLNVCVTKLNTMSNKLLSELRCQVVISENDDQTLPKFDDLLLLTNSRGQQVFGLQKGKQPIFKKHLIHSTLVSQLDSSLNQTICFELNILVAARECVFLPGLTMRVQVVTSIISNLRRFRAFASLQEFQLVKHILSPNYNDQLFSIPNPNKSQRSEQLNFFKKARSNETQQQVITEATSLVCDGSVENSKLYMIQGPPGTGKSHTIVNIIRSIALRWNNNVRGKKLKILVCAPSNGACNEITRKLLDQCDNLKIIRMGRDEGLFTPNEPRLQQLSIETIVEQLLNTDPFLLQGDRAKRSRVLKQRQIEEADIVVCTLNYTGNLQFDPFCVKQPTQRSSFDLLIVDEASQCLELDVFIPLRLGIRRVLLVGDPEQLPPTVISNRAQNAKFGQSLMERLYSLFKSNNLIRMLNIQYRMAEEICRFPSAHIYGGKLLTDDETRRKRSEFPLKSYVFINVLDSLATANTISQSYSNRREADCVVRLFRFLTNKVNMDISSIGIITPYKQQVELIKNQIRTPIDIGTVDGFQGREKDVILLSTVRAHPDEQKRPTIGFVADRRRLNVALTRCKYGMYIIGHVNSLKINRDWHALIQDAESRKCIFDYSPHNSFNWLSRKLI